MQKRIVLIGAGSTNFGLGTIGDIFKSNVLKDSTIVLHDINVETLKNSEIIAKNYNEKLIKIYTHYLFVIIYTHHFSPRFMSF